MSLFSKISGAFEPLREKFGGWWDERNPRERIILKVAVPLCLIFLIYSFAWQPLMDSLDTASADNPQLEQNWPQILELAGRIQELSNAGYSIQNMQRPTQAIILEKFKAAGLATTSNQFNLQYNQDGAIISIKAASFDHLLQVLERIHVQNGLVVSKFSAQHVGPGLADVNFMLGK